MASLLEIAQGKTHGKTRMRSSYREFQQQCLFVQRCDMHPDVKHLKYTASMQGINLPELQAKLAKAKGVKKGVPDWMLFRYVEARGATVTGIQFYVGLALEFKDPEGNGRPTVEQEEWANALRAEGWRVEFPTTAEDAWAILVEYLDLRR